jgi:undecaprenyl-diphosphatase
MADAAGGDDPQAGAAPAGDGPAGDEAAGDAGRGRLVIPSRSFRIGTAVVGAVLFAWGWVVARSLTPADWEIDVVRELVDADAAATVLEPVMQAGSLAAPLVVAVVAGAVSRRIRPAIDILLAGVAAWWFAQVAKDLVGRGRPSFYLPELLVREETASSLGFPSGHASVAFAVATALAVGLPARWRPVPLVVAVLVGVGRIVHGVHFPIDVVGGAGLGILCGLGIGLLLDALGVEWSSAPGTGVAGDHVADVP